VSKLNQVISQRVLKASRDSENIGWGFEEAIYVLVEDIEEFFKKDQNDT